MKVSDIRFSCVGCSSAAVRLLLLLMTCCLAALLGPKPCSAKDLIAREYAWISTFRVEHGVVYYAANPRMDCRLYRVPAGGGERTLLMSGAVVGDSGISSFDVVGDTIFAGWGNYDVAFVSKIPASGGENTHLFQTAQGYYFAANSTDVFYCRSWENIWRTDRNGRNHQLLTPGNWVRRAAMDATDVYYFEYFSRHLRKFNMQTHAVTDLAYSAAEGLLFIDSAYVYTSAGGISRVPKAGGAMSIVSADPNVTGYCSDGHYVYATRASNSIIRIPVNGGDEENLVPSGNEDIENVIVSDGYLYWIAGTGTQWSVYRQAIGSGSTAITPTGFYYPTGTGDLGTYWGWLAAYNGEYHLAKDIRANVNDPVFAVDDGVIIGRSINGWDNIENDNIANIGLLIRHELADGTPYVAVYGHVISSLPVGAHVTAGQTIATVGPWDSFPHLHFGVHPGLDIRPPYGWVGPAVSPSYNGFTNPITWIETRAPGQAGARTVAAWGDNGNGQCVVPTPNEEFTAVAAGFQHSLGLKSDGSVSAWGANDYGQCDVPAPNANFISVTAGYWHSAGVKTDGSIVAWGRNNVGQCNVPSPNASFVSVDASEYNCIGLKSDGSVAVWGGNGYGQCSVPEPNGDFVAVEVGSSFCLGLKINGSIIGWGRNDFGQCDVPLSNTGFASVAAGEGHGLGLKHDGSIVAWGFNGNGECTVPSPNAAFADVAAGTNHSLGLKSDGSIVAWGERSAGQCDVPLLNTGFTDLAGGFGHSLGLKSGSNASLGGLVTDASTGVPIAGAMVTIFPYGARGSTTANDVGAWSLQIASGDGYRLEISAPGYITSIDEGLSLDGASNFTLDRSLSPVAFSTYRIVDFAAAPVPSTVEVPEGGYGYVWLVIEGFANGAWLPVSHARVTALDDSGDSYTCESSQCFYKFLTEPFNLQNSGLFGIRIAAETIGNGRPAGSESVRIMSVNGQPLAVGNQRHVQIEVVPCTYTSDFGYRIHGKIGAGGTAGVATAMGFAGGGSGSTIGLSLDGYSSNPAWRNFSIRRQRDLFLEAEAGLGPPRIIDVQQHDPLQVSSKSSLTYGEEYEFDLNDLSGMEALAAFYLFAEPALMFGPPVPQLSIQFLSWMAQALIEGAVANGIEGHRIADQAGLDVEGAAHAGVDLGLGSVAGFEIGGGASLGAESHAGGSIRSSVGDVTDKSLYVNGAYEASFGPRIFGDLDGVEVSGFVPVNWIASPSVPNYAKVGFELGSRYRSGEWEEGRLAASLTTDSELFSLYDLPGSREEYEFFVTIDNVALRNLLQNTAQLPQQANNIGATLVRVAMDNQSFKDDYTRFLEKVYEQQLSNSPFVIPYGYDVSAIQEFQLDMEFTFPLGVVPSVVLGFGGGMSASKVDKYALGRGHFAGGLPLLTTELAAPPQNDIECRNVLGQLWVKMLGGDAWQNLRDVILPNLWDKAIFWDKSTQILSPGGSTLDIERAAIPASTDSVRCRHWAWSGSVSPGKELRSDQARILNSYNNYLRAQREAIAGMRYGIGGFYKLEPDNVGLLQPATLTICYADSEVVGMNESTLGVYYQDVDGAWTALPSVAIPDSNMVRAEIGAFHTYTLGPRMPQGQYALTPDIASLMADGMSTTTFTSGQLCHNDGQPVEDGELFTVSASDGTIQTADADALRAGVQVPVIGHALQFVYQSGQLPVDVDVVAESVVGFARCTSTIRLADAGAPSAPIITAIVPRWRGFTVEWESAGDIDVGGYLVWFDTDGPGSPYNGKATVWGESSPISVGLVDSLVVEALVPGQTYYVAITALDLEGNQSAYSTEFTVAVSGVRDQDLPAVVSLEQNFPNPFNPTTKIQYGVPRAGRVTLKIFDVRGRLVKTLVDGLVEAGRHEELWRGDDGNGRQVASGVYLYLLKTEQETRTRKMVVVR